MQQVRAGGEDALAGLGRTLAAYRTVVLATLSRRVAQRVLLSVGIAFTR
jgi:hypothetical protein